MNAPSRIAPPFPLNPTVGERHGNWVWNGVVWVCAPTTGIQVLTTVFTASGPYMPSPGLVSVVVECIGGGGGGGGVGSPSPLDVFAGSGGGSGGKSIKTLPAALVLGGVQIAVGAGGTAGGNQGQAGNGGATTFGALCQANGGGGGWAMYPNVTAPEPGAGATPGIGDVAAPGASGDWGFWQVLSAGNTNVTLGTPLGGVIGYGGNAGVMIGGGGAQNGPSSTGGTGAGGAGGIMNQYPTAFSVAGGAGGSGLCVVTEYCWATGDVEDCMNPPINVHARVAVTQVPWTGPGPCPPGWGQGPYVEYEGE